MRNIYIVLLCIVLFCFHSKADEQMLYSPDKSIKLSVSLSDCIRYSVFIDGIPILAPSKIDLVINNVSISKSLTLIGVSRDEHSGFVVPSISHKNNKITDKYNSLILTFESFDVEFRAYDDGVAYRFVTHDIITEKVFVNHEIAEFLFNHNHSVYFPEEESLMTHQERQYLKLYLSEIHKDRFCSSPVLVDIGDHKKVLITESGLRDYPGLFLQGVDNGYGFEGKFAPYPLKETLVGDRDMFVTEHADYMAITEAARQYPWRVIIISREDADLIMSELVYLLAPESELEDISWIKPGKVAWDWWNANNIRNVDFRAGVNTETYKYYIDFAATFGLEYVILDEGWSDTRNVLSVAPEIDLNILTKYADEKGVGLILWVLWNSLEEKKEEAFIQYEKWGIKGVKVDFMQRDDQKMVNFYWDIARIAAKHQMLVNLHGSYRPTGLRRAYPNVITKEGLLGNEHNKWSDHVTPEHALILPFIRMVSGPMDFTPGAMNNANPENFYISFTRPMSQGTRCHQLAMYINYESPMQMLCDNPTNYYNEPDCMRFLMEVPSIWDESIVLEAKIGEYLMMARRKNKTWYLGGMNGPTAKSFTCSLDFLSEGTYSAEFWIDGINADRDARDYYNFRKDVQKDSEININMFKGGGFVAIIKNEL